MNDVQLSGIHEYPVKSLSGLDLDRAFVRMRGLNLDRRWMVVDDTGYFLTQRNYPRMAVLKTSYSATHLIIEAPGVEPLRVSRPLMLQDGLQVEVWGDMVTAVSAGNDAQAWLSEQLGVPCKLVYMPDDVVRPVDPDYAPDGHPVSFADGFPLLLISEASLAELNKRLESPVPMNRFRPNLVVTGCTGFEEDSWRLIRIGEVTFRVAKPCARCSIPTVDQEKGMVSGKEPTRTLATFRQFGGKVYFGQNLIPETEGNVRIGDPVSILETI